MSSSRGRARFGVLVPYTNTNLEPDMTLMRPEGVSLHVARMGGYDQDEVPDHNQMHGLGAADLTEPLRLLQAVNPDVILYGCTSATLTHGPAFDRSLAQQIKQESGAETVTAAGALGHALSELGIGRIGFASPYVAAINDMAIDFLAEIGIETVKRSEVGAALDNYGQGELTPEAVYELGKKADHPEAEAIVLSCTDMRSVEIIAQLEARVGKPVITSNQAMVYQGMQLAGLSEPLVGFGQLLGRER
ncbi:aspartate/glutamate racemase family protein [Sulfitobacter sp. TSTF-M16]|uniref:Aspartate/glutamate racemase family protein n=1 Tax=Sulfitobacter aestuariivivens TaxID=2766981 RepID=A0A927D506_9RHOB|nr:aspartate/glutamate racemase family protein [Sulfitobacter aestuariivivens]MBD3664491.1 aspartate/glutamate racemase family protein [Sulfitobacter aestuariivivens]